MAHFSERFKAILIKGLLFGGGGEMREVLRCEMEWNKWGKRLVIEVHL